jgi:hypothetical protein
VVASDSFLRCRSGADKIVCEKGEQMKDSPILMSGPMAKAILEDRKTMTRRVVKPQPASWVQELSNWYQDGMPECPYGIPGDRLWVRETFSARRTINGKIHNDMPVIYRADGGLADASCGWRPSIFMPRWASRITLEITDVRVERLQEITEEDCISEGLKLLQGGIRSEFAVLWDSINGKTYPWASNPWVFVIAFRRLP